MELKKPRRSLNIAVLYNKPLTDNKKPIKKDELVAEEDTSKVKIKVVRNLWKLGHKPFEFEVNAKSIRSLRNLKPDVFFNLCEGRGYKFACKVISILEASKIPFTGATSKNCRLTTDKAKTKKKLLKIGIPTPDWQCFHSRHDRIFNKTKNLFPVIVKPCFEDGSIGINHRSVVDTPLKLRRRVNYILRNYQQPALVEKYINTREFTVTVLAVKSKLKILPIQEVVFRNSYRKKRKIITFSAKWEKTSRDYQDYSLSLVKNLSLNLKNKLLQISKLIFKKFNCKDYIRIDFRFDEDTNTPYVTEVNANPSLEGLNSLYRMLSVGGYSYKKYLQAIVNSALGR